VLRPTTESARPDGRVLIEHGDGLTRRETKNAHPAKRAIRRACEGSCGLEFAGFMESCEVVHVRVLQSARACILKLRRVRPRFQESHGVRVEFHGDAHVAFNIKPVSVLRDSTGTDPGAQSGSSGSSPERRRVGEAFAARLDRPSPGLRGNGNSRAAHHAGTPMRPPGPRSTSIRKPLRRRAAPNTAIHSHLHLGTRSRGGLRSVMNPAVGRTRSLASFPPSTNR
jgi:hypothetical protein